MKLMSIVLLFISLVYNSKCIHNPTYTSKYDNVDLDEVLSSERLLTSYINCLLDLGTCTPDGKELKNNLPDAIANNCSSCTERQREGADKVMHFIIDNRPGDWTELEQKYNSDGQYKKQYIKSKQAIRKTEKNIVESKEINGNNSENMEYLSKT